MIKGAALSIFISIFLVSLVFFISGLSGGLQENLVTGAVIGSAKIVNYSSIFLMASLIGILLMMSSAVRASNTGKLEKLSEQEAADTAMDFIFRLARDESWKDKDAAEAIAKNIKSLEQNRYFPHVFDRIDPDQMHSETKLMTPEARQRLNYAIELYQQKYLGK